MILAIIWMKFALSPEAMNVVKLGPKSSKIRTENEQ